MGEIINLIRNIARFNKVDDDLCVAIAGRESNYVNSRCRYEPEWKYLITPEKYALTLGITTETEIQQQKFSYSAMQVMGSVARELGFNGYLNELTLPEVGLLFAILKVKQLCKKYPNITDVISAYNQGSPKMINGSYVNSAYVENVLLRLKKIKSH